VNQIRRKLFGRIAFEATLAPMLGFGFVVIHDADPDTELALIVIVGPLALGVSWERGHRHADRAGPKGVVNGKG
jgi:hypothetical protein